jgi:RNase P/RNase MRP subunit POP5
MSLRARAIPALIAATAFVALSACSSDPKVDKDDLAKEVSSKLEEQVGQKPKNVDCPDDLEGKKDATTKCILTADDDSTYDVTVTVTSVDGSNVKFDIKVADEPN